jgi:hypothetical protein
MIHHLDRLKMSEVRELTKIGLIVIYVLMNLQVDVIDSNMVELLMMHLSTID